MELLSRWFRRSFTPLRRVPSRPHFRPALEILEDRLSPATFVVTLTTDTGLTNSTVTPLGPGTVGDLRNAIFQADQTPGTQNVIDLTGVSGTITLSAMLPPIFTTGSGSLLIEGPGAANLTISGGGAVRPFFITSGTVGIANLTVGDGLAQGGAGGAGSAGGGGGAGLGGGLLIDGTLGATTVTLTNVTFTGNLASGGAGGAGSSGNNSGGGGGAGGNGGAGGACGLFGDGGGGGFLGNGGGVGGIHNADGGGGGFTGAGGNGDGNGASIGGGGGGGGTGSTGGGDGQPLGSCNFFSGGGGSTGFPGSSPGTTSTGPRTGVGGFGGGGGSAAVGGDYGGAGGSNGTGAAGGFGGGGGGGDRGGNGGNGGFGGGGAGAGRRGSGGLGMNGGGNGDNSNGGGGAGLGGALFQRAGTLYLINDTFTNNTATGGATGGGTATAGTSNGGAIFIFDASQGGTATARSLGAAPTFSGNVAASNANVSGTLTTDTGATMTASAGTPQSTNVSTAFATALQVTLKDGSGNPVPNAVITFTVPGSGASATLSATTATTNDGGQGSVTATANGTGGAFTIAASAGGLSASFSLTNIAPTNQFFAVGAAAGGGPEVVVYNAKTGAIVATFYAFDPSFGGGVPQVAVDDINGDGTSDIICAAGPGGGPQIIVVDGSKLTQVQSNGEIASTALLASFDAFAPGFSGGVFVAAGTSSSGQNWIAAGAGAGGGPQVVVWTAKAVLAGAAAGTAPTVLTSFYAFSTGFSGGVTVALGDVNGDGKLDVIAGAGPGGGPQVIVVDGTKFSTIPSTGILPNGALLASFYAFVPGFSGGVFVSGGATAGKQFNLIVGQGVGGAPQALVINGAQLSQVQQSGQIASSAVLDTINAFSSAFTGGVRVGFSAAFGSSGKATILTGEGLGGSPQVAPFDGASFQALSTFFAFLQNFSGGLFIAG